MTKILIAVDGSKTSINAVDYVVKRRQRGERVQAIILNVQRAISPRGGLITRAMIKEYQAQEGEKALGIPKIKAMKNYLKADDYMEIGDPAERIVAFAQKSECDEIVMGSRGFGSVKGLLLGSIASKVIQISPIPVIIVK